MNLERRTEALLALVEQYRERRRQELLNPANAEAGETLRAALAEARRRVSTAIAEERRRYAVETGAIEAALATDRRLAGQRHAVRLLEAAQHELRQRLIAQWIDPRGRSRWTTTHLRRALAAVPRDAPWRIEHHPAWSGGERAAGADALRNGGVADLRFVADPGIAAGLRVISGHNVLDATIAGLLADRAQLEGRLLHYLVEDAIA